VIAGGRTRGFTLVEVLVALMVCAAILGSVTSVLSGAVRAHERIQESAARRAAIEAAAVLAASQRLSAGSAPGGLTVTMRDYDLPQMSRHSIPPGTLREVAIDSPRGKPVLRTLKAARR
jgi:prepilin-type N-terminal cleavage/methylation domain-containing protein